MRMGAAKLMMSRGLVLPTFLGFTSAGQTSSTTVTVDLPSGVVEDDLLVALMSATGNFSWTGDTGWTERIDQGLAPGLRVATKVAGGSEPSNYTFTFGNGSAPVAQILAFRNGEFDAIGSIATLSGDGDLAAPSVSLSPGIVVAAFGSQSQLSRTHSTPSGMTATETTKAFTNSISAFYEESPSTGASGTRTSTMAGGSGVNAAVLLGVKKP